MKRKNDLFDDAQEYKKLRLQNPDTLRTELCLKIFKMDLEKEINEILDTINNYGFINKEFAYTIFEFNEKDIVNPTEATQLILNKLSTQGFLLCIKEELLRSRDLYYLVEGLIIQGVNINAVDSTNKSFIHNYYDFIKNDYAYCDMHLLNALIAQDEIGYYKNIQKKYANLAIDKPFLEALLYEKDWDRLADIRGIHLDKCADKAEIKALVDDTFRTNLCYRLFNWSPTDSEETKYILQAAINSKAMFYLTNELEYQIDDYEDEANFDEYVSALVDKLIEDGVNYHHKNEDGKSFLHQYYIFNNTHPNGGEGFMYAVDSATIPLPIDKFLLDELLAEQDWPMLTMLFKDRDNNFQIEISPEYYKRLEQLILSDTKNYEDNVDEDEISSQVFLEYAHIRMIARNKHVTQPRNNYTFFHYLTNNTELGYYLPKELQAIVANNFEKIGRADETSYIAENTLSLVANHKP